ncbi:MAG: hypothetical protein ACJA0H_001848 [Francisellaceae bacterium]
MVLPISFTCAYSQTGVLAEKKISGVSVKYESEVDTNSKDINALMNGIALSNPSIKSIFYKKIKIIAVSELPDLASNYTPEDIENGAQDSLTSAENMFCMLKAHNAGDWNLIRKYTYEYNMISLDHIWLGNITVEPDKLKCLVEEKKLPLVSEDIIGGN